MKKSKYKGGSKIVSFRLPKEKLHTATIEIYNLLKKYEDASVTEVAHSEAKHTKQPTKPIHKQQWSCGCYMDGVLFIRNILCKQPRGAHTLTS